MESKIQSVFAHCGEISQQGILHTRPQISNLDFVLTA